MRNHWEQWFSVKKAKLTKNMRRTKTENDPLNHREEYILKQKNSKRFPFEFCIPKGARAKAGPP